MCRQFNSGPRHRVWSRSINDDALPYDGVTILYAAARQSFVVIAADGASTQTDSEGKESAVSDARKIYVSDKRRLAIAASGFAYVLGQPVLSLVSTAVERVGDADSHTIATRLLTELSPAILGEMSRFQQGARGVPPPKTAFAIGQVRAGKADLAFAKIEDRGPGEVSAVPASDGGAFYGPMCLEEYARSFTADELLGARSQTKADLRQHALGLVVRCINLERDLHGENLHCGFPVAIAVVDENGVQAESVAPV